ncbi:hypothetical protein BDN67DRAFT_1014827 [Paxillus ammoniavirescens]|nr:hypothetical protein BDN67DRAFT_1014827 [Paxillus ammoniavirescens]
MTSLKVSSSQQQRLSLKMDNPPVPITPTHPLCVCFIFLMMAHYGDKSCNNPGHPLPTHLVSTDDVDSDTMEDIVEEQVGGGHHPPSPLPFQTPTCLRTTVKATSCDSGIVRDAQVHRECLLAQVLLDLQPVPEQESDLFCSNPIPHCSSNPMPQISIQCASFLFPGSQGTSEHPLFPPPEDGSRDVQNPTQPPPESPSGNAGMQVHMNVLPARKVLLAEISLQSSLDSWCLAHNQSQHSCKAVDAQCPSVEEVVLFNPLQTKALGTASDSDTPRPHPQQHSSADLKTGDIGNKGTWDVPTFSSAVDEIDIDIPDCPDSPFPPSDLGRSLQLSTSLLQETKGKRVDRSAQSQQIFTVGRTATTVAAVLDKAFETIHSQFTELGGQVGMPAQQVIARFTKQFSRNNTFNNWNIYQKYFTANKAHELRRLVDTDNVTTTPTEKMSQCYRAFRDEFPDVWQEILATYEEAELLGDIDKTVAQCQQLFHKSTRKLAQLFAVMAKSHVIEGAFVMAGSVVNQDGSLVFTFTTPGAENFFVECCRADENEIIAHFKVHIYNKSSLTNIAQTYEVDNQQEGPLAKKEAEDDDNIPEVDDSQKCEDHALVRSKLVQALKKVGCKWALGKLFPWKNLPAKLAKNGIVCNNYLGSVSFPGKEQEPKPKGGSKGISDSTLGERSILVTALSDTSRDGLHFKHVPDLKAELLASWIPVIHGAAPDHDSPHAHAKGLPRKHNPIATRVKKGTSRQPPQNIETISIPDSDEVAVPKRRVRCPAPSIHDSDDIKEVSGPSVEKQRPTHAQKKPEVIITHSTKVLKKMTIVSKSGDFSSGEHWFPTSGLEYQPVGDDARAGEPDESLAAGKTDAPEYKETPLSRKSWASATKVQPSKVKNAHHKHLQVLSSLAISSDDDFNPAAVQPQANKQPPACTKEVPSKHMVQTPADIPPRVSPLLPPKDTTAPSTDQPPCAQPPESVTPNNQQGSSDAQRASAAIPAPSTLPNMVASQPSAPLQLLELLVPVTKARVATEQDPQDVFSLRKRIYSSDSNMVPLSVPSANLLAAEEGHLGSGTPSDASHPKEKEKPSQDPPLRQQSPSGGSTTTHRDPLPP